jgi:hypothetical protein
MIFYFKNFRMLVGIRIRTRSGLSNSLDPDPDSAEDLDPDSAITDPKHWAEGSVIFASSCLESLVELSFPLCYLLVHHEALLSRSHFTTKNTGH